MDYLKEIYKNGDVFLKQRLDDWAMGHLYYIEDEEYSFEMAYNIFKKWISNELNQQNNFVKAKENEIKWIIEHNQKHKIVLPDLKNKSKYTKRQKELYKELQDLCVKFNSKNFNKNYYTGDWEGFDKTIEIFYINANGTEEKELDQMAHYRFINNTIQIHFDNYSTTVDVFVRLFKKLIENKEEEILSHFFKIDYIYNDTDCYILAKDTYIEDWKKDFFCYFVIT